MHFHGYELSPVISDEDIQKRVNEIAIDLSKKFKEEVPILIGILNGSFIFMADLIRALDI
ncbi:MAG TPA: hypoxanthine phosphoribosyltransferase, partial [Candidatus Marinimicrobia bacterium]|nr:hypoxanthine phosphoribosyltransferase [Candidatus Neomarinimicrobiota bacterium]